MAVREALASPAASPPPLPLRARGEKTARVQREKHRIAGRAARARLIRISLPTRRPAWPKEWGSNMILPASGKPPYFAQEIDWRKRFREVPVRALLLSPKAVTRRRLSAHQNDRNALICLRVLQSPAD